VQDVMQFLAQAGNEAEPTYLDFVPVGYVPYKPVWGQNGWKRLEIIHGTAYKGELFFIASARRGAGDHGGAADQSRMRWG